MEVHKAKNERNERSSLRKTTDRFAGSFSQIVNSGAILSVVGHLSVTEIPHLQETSIEKTTTWNEQTREEIHLLSDTYALKYKMRNPKSNLETTDLKKRFDDFLQTYAPDFNIVFINKEETLDDFAAKFVVYLTGRHGDTAHFGARKIYYPYRTIPDHEDPRPHHLESFDHFFAELAHYLNNDDSPGRIIAYAKGLVESGFHQTKMYNDARSAEFQAHEITEKALRLYFFSLPESNASLSFREAYDAMYAFYSSVRNADALLLPNHGTGLIQDFMHRIFADPKRIITVMPTLVSNLKRIQEVVFNSSELLEDEKATVFTLVSSYMPTLEVQSPESIQMHVEMTVDYLHTRIRNAQYPTTEEYSATEYLRDTLHEETGLSAYVAQLLLHDKYYYTLSTARSGYMGSADLRKKGFDEVYNRANSLAITYAPKEPRTIGNYYLPFRS